MVNSTTNTHIILRRNEQNVKKFVALHPLLTLRRGSPAQKWPATACKAAKKPLTKVRSGVKVVDKQSISLTETPVYQTFPCQRAPGAG